MTDAAIEEATGITNSTFHRWQKGNFGRTGPSAHTVWKFCDGLGIPRKVAADLLGWSTDESVVIGPEPELPSDFREILRRLRDPNVPETEKFHIRETIRSLAARPKTPTGAAARKK